MSAILIASQALGFNFEQLQACVQFWNLPSLLADPERARRELKANLFLSDKLIQSFLDCLKQSKTDQGFDTAKFCQSLWTDEEAYEALALLQYFQQRFYAKGQYKEECMTQPSAFTEDNAALIQTLAREQFAMVGARSLSENTDLTLMFGATSKTCQTYIDRFLEEKRTHQLGKLYLFLSTRPLRPDTSNDDPSSSEGFFFKAKEEQKYVGFLRETFLERYNEFMTKHFPNFKASENPCEGMVMLQRLEATLEKPFEQLIELGELVPVYTGTQDSMDFYEQATEKAFKQGDLKAGSKVALSTIQPYCARYAKQFETVCRKLARQKPALKALSAVGGLAYGASGSEKPEILAQNLAVVINIAYDEAVYDMRPSLPSNRHPVPKTSLGGSFEPKPFVFFVSDLEETHLALDTARLLAQNPRQVNIFIPLGLSAAACLEQQKLPENIKTESLAKIIGQEVSTRLNDEQLSTLSAYLKEQKVSHAYVGMPVNPSEEKALQISAALTISQTFVYGVLQEPSQQHKCWAHFKTLRENPRAKVAVPFVAVGEKLFEQPLAIGHPNLEDYQAEKIDQQAIEGIKKFLALDDQDFTFVSGSTKSIEAEKVFIKALLSELVNYPQLQVRFFIDPSREDNSDYVKELLGVCEGHQKVAGQFKIVMSSVIAHQLEQEGAEECLKSNFVMRSDVDHSQAAQLATRVAALEPGPLVHVAAKAGKPSYYHQGASHLPSRWFSKNVATFFQSKQEVPPSVNELGLSSEVSAAESLARLF